MNRPIPLSGWATFVYRNHRGDVSQRTVAVKRIWYGLSPYHQGEQWFLNAEERKDDDEDYKERDFAVRDIESWPYDNDCNSPRERLLPALCRALVEVENLKAKLGDDHA